MLAPDRMLAGIALPCGLAFAPSLSRRTSRDCAGEGTAMSGAPVATKEGLIRRSL